MAGTYAYTHFTTLITSYIMLIFNGGINVLNRLFIDGRWYDPVYRERTWLRVWRRFWRRK